MGRPADPVGGFSGLTAIAVGNGARCPGSAASAVDDTMLNANDAKALQRQRQTGATIRGEGGVEPDCLSGV